ncbi:MAG: HIT family protein [Candidatus ainarchaeum sp.]|nr:HIT family protein [Candidatus ainarchaeum sp.]
MDDCIFCKIISGDVPCYKIYEDEYVLAFLDINPVVNGHTLVIPKKHFVNIFDVDNFYLEKVTAAIKKISVHYNQKFDGINILNANDKSAQQSVFHLHFHIIPRTIDDGKDFWPYKEVLDKTDLKTMAERLKL